MSELEYLVFHFNSWNTFSYLFFPNNCFRTHGGWILGTGFCLVIWLLFFPSFRVRAQLIVLSLTGQPRTTCLHNHQFSFCSMLVLCNLGSELTNTIASPLAIMDLFPRGWRRTLLRYVMYFTWSFFYFLFSSFLF